MDNKVEPRTLSGTMELLPKEQIKFNNMLDKIKNVYEKFGFLPLDTPIIELSEVLLAKAGGETEKQIYRFNKGDNDLCLRFDLTVPLAKYVSKNQNELAFPFRRYQIGKVYRGERPQKGRYREFYQCDIDIIGDDNLSVLNDAEMPSIIYNIFSELDFGDFTICINNRKILNGLFEELGLKDMQVDVMRIIDKIDKIGIENVKEEFRKINVPESIIQKIEEFLNISGSNSEKIEKLGNLKIENEIFKIGFEELKQVIEAAYMFGVPEKNINIDLKIARGLDYYTGTVYETILNDYKSLGSVCSGGRYDNLAEFYSNKKFPGVGISIGLTRLFYQLNEMNLIKEKDESMAQVLVTTVDNNFKEAVNVATKLRTKNIKTEIYLNDKKLKQKMKYADKLEIPYVLLVGGEELEKGEYVLKNMKTGEQLSVKKDSIIDSLRLQLDKI
ncbi:MAG: histidine--tRNA ligase [Clostridia bacterium]|nr:histidine--tRNA ligase [Clostridia bacterium]